MSKVGGMIRTVLWELPFLFTGLLDRLLAWLTVRLKTSLLVDQGQPCMLALLALCAADTGAAYKAVNVISLRQRCTLLQLLAHKGQHIGCPAELPCTCLPR